jgi:PAS domain S-box-containing protein
LIAVFPEAEVVAARKTGQKRTVKGTRIVRKKAPAILKNTVRSGVADLDGRFKMILDAAGDAIVVFTGDGNISYWNRAAERLFGYKAKEVIGSELEVIIPERYRDHYRNALESRKKEKKPRSINQSFESEAIRRTGEEFPISASVSTAQIDGVQYLIGIVRDISALRSAQNALGDSVARYQMMYESQKDGIILIDMESQRFLEVNRAAAQMYGYSKDEMLKKRIVDVFAEVEKGAKLTPESATEFNIIKHRRKDGSVFPGEMTGCVLLWKNRKTFCAIVRDASDKNDPGK